MFLISEGVIERLLTPSNNNPTSDDDGEGDAEEENDDDGIPNSLNSCRHSG